MICVFLIDDIVLLNELQTMPSDKIVYRFENWLLSDLISCLRPWLILENTSYCSYKPECLEWLEKNKHLPKCPLPRTLYTIDSKCFQELEWCMERLRRLGYTIQEKIIDYVSYTCDIPNRLEDLYGQKMGSFIYDFYKQDRGCKDFIYSLEQEPSHEGKLKIIINTPEDILEQAYKFLPEDIKINLSFGCIETTLVPDCDRLDKLGGDVVDNPWKYVRQDVFNAFILGNKYTGQEIKNILQEIYLRHGIKDKSRVQDIFNYFETSLSDDRSGVYRFKMIRRRT